MLANLRLKIRPSETQTSKTDILIFLSNKKVLVGAIYITFFIYLKAIFGQKLKEIDFSTLPIQCSIFSDRRSETPFQF